MPERTPQVIGIVGSRRRDTDNDYRLLVKMFDSIYVEGDTIVSGGCPKGADRMADDLAMAYGTSITTHYPRAKLGTPDAYFERNTLIARDCDVLIALCTDDRKGGTEDTVRKVIALDKVVVYV